MRKKITLGICASSAIWKACPLIERLQNELDAEVNVVMTQASMEFIQPLMFQTISKNPVFTKMTDETKDNKIAHIHLAQSCDLLLIVPITANTIGKIAYGFADDLLTAIAVATPKKTPKLLAPAMNDQMYQQEVVQGNLATLKKRGYIEIPPREDILSSGKKAIGVLAELDEIIVAAKTALSEK